MRSAELDTRSLRGIGVLVVDDNPSAREILREMLSDWGMNPTVVDSGASALEHIEIAANMGRPFPIILIDARLPEVSGFSIADTIKRDPLLATARIVMLTSIGLGDDTQCRERGISSYLNKPISRSDLLDVMTNIKLGPQDEEPASHEESTMATAPLTILLAEDNPVNQIVATRLLEKRGHTVIVAETGRKVLETTKSRIFDLVLMDVQLPEMDGLEATVAIRQREKLTGNHLPIIAMTANAMTGDRDRCLASGMDGYITKPLSVEALFESVEDVQMHRK